MRRLETLPDDQRAVLALLLRQGRRYDDLAQLLRLDGAAVRRRAHDALRALGPDETPGLDPARRDEIADYLLGQQGDEQRTATHGLLEGSAAGRAWARVVADELRELAGDRLPPIPSDGRGDGAPAPASAPPAAEAAATPLDKPAATAAAPPEHRPARPRSSRRRTTLVIGAVALAAVAVALVVVLQGGNDDTRPATTTARTSPTQPRAQIEAQVNLLPPSSRTRLRAVGVVLVQRVQSQRQIVAVVQGLPQSKRGSYGIWLYTGPGKAQWLGRFATRDSRGRLLARGLLPVPIAAYREVLITREVRGNPVRPGPVFLRGPIQAAAGGG